jgi:predicted phage terminase large subunit-like protein
MSDFDRLLQAALRSSLCTFADCCHAHLFPAVDLQMNWHIELLAAKLEAVERGEIKRLVINIPPRNLKSLLGSVALPAWILGRNPSAQIICVSYAQDLAEKLARDCLSVMNARFYLNTFATRISRNRQAVNDFNTTQGGCRLATSIGGVLTGRGADWIIIDDPLKPDEALSEVRRNGVNQWYGNTLLSRLNDKRHGAIVVIMQRLHEDDLTGYLLQQEGWEVVNLPAIAERDEAFVVKTPGGIRRFSRNAGEALHAEREPLSLLAGLRQTMGEFAFAAQYQQSPVPLEGGLLKQAWLQTYRAADLPAKFETVLQSWDTANKPTQLSDYSVCTTWGIANERLYLLHVFRDRLDYPSLKRAVRAQAAQYGAGVVLIEDRASGTQLIQELQSEGMHVVTRYDPGGSDKIMRFLAQTSSFESGLALLPDKADWLAQYIQELTIFPYGKYDDQVDSTAQALHWYRNKSPVPGIILHYEQQLRARGIDPATIKTPLQRLEEAAAETARKAKEAVEVDLEGYARAMRGRPL